MKSIAVSASVTIVAYFNFIGQVSGEYTPEL